MTSIFGDIIEIQTNNWHKLKVNTSFGSSMTCLFGATNGRVNIIIINLMNLAENIIKAYSILNNAGYSFFSAKVAIFIPALSHKAQQRIFFFK